MRGIHVLFRNVCVYPVQLNVKISMPFVYVTERMGCNDNIRMKVSWYVLIKC